MRKITFVTKKEASIFLMNELAEQDKQLKNEGLDLDLIRNVLHQLDYEN